MTNRLIVELCAPDSPPDTGMRCQCWLCGFDNVIPLPLDHDQSNFIECDFCGIDNELPADIIEEPIMLGLPDHRLNFRQ